MFVGINHTLHVYCMDVEAGEIQKVANVGTALSNFGCSKEMCCGNKVDGRTYCFELNTFTCGADTIGSSTKVITRIAF